MIVMIEECAVGVIFIMKEMFLSGMIFIKCHNMGYAIYEVGQRWGGYGVPTTCEHPKCKKKIDRGMSYACGGEPFSEHGCDRYFCGKHLHYVYFTPDGDRCIHTEDCKCELVQVCERCRDLKAHFPYKPERKEWARHLLKHKSWAEWRKNNPKKVKELSALISK